MAGLDRQLATLRRQARAAERYRGITDQIRVAEARLLFARWRDAAAAADAARKEAASCEAAVGKAQSLAAASQDAQAAAAGQLAKSRELLADRRDDANAQGHRLTALTGQLEAAQQRLADLDRQRSRLESDRGDADRLTHDAAEALARLEKAIAEGSAALEQDEALRPRLANTLEGAERTARTAELDLAQATAQQAGIEAEWRVVDAEVSQARMALDRLAQDTQRIEGQLAALASAPDPEAAVLAARKAAQTAAAALAQARTALEAAAARKGELQAARDNAASALAGARADLTGIEREHAALLRDREARAKGAKAAHGLTPAIDALRAAPGYERALAAVLGRDAKAPLGPAADTEGRFWTGADAPPQVSGSLLDHVPQCPAELRARLSLVQVADSDDGRTLKPGEWLVTRGGVLRRWDGFVARGEGASEAARLEAENRFADLAAQLPPLRQAVAEAEAAQVAVQQELSALQAGLAAAERAVSDAANAERGALRAADQAEDARQRHSARAEELGRGLAELAQRREAVETELAAAEGKRSALPDPAAGRTALEAARTHSAQTRQAMMTATATLAAHDQALAAARERLAAQRADMKGWQLRAGDAAQRLAKMAGRLEEIEAERAATAARPEALFAQIDQAQAIRDRLAGELAEAEARLADAGEADIAAATALAAAREALAAAREARAGATARAENEDMRRMEMNRIAGERFQCPPPVLPERHGFKGADVGPVSGESSAARKAGGRA